jgi:hypothetical protein
LLPSCFWLGCSAIVFLKRRDLAGRLSSFIKGDIRGRSRHWLYGSYHIGGIAARLAEMFCSQDAALSTSC